VRLIAAIEGRAHVHTQNALLARVTVASEDATFRDVPHLAGVCAGSEPFRVEHRRGKVFGTRVRD